VSRPEQRVVQLWRRRIGDDSPPVGVLLLPDSPVRRRVHSGVRAAPRRERPPGVIRADGPRIPGPRASGRAHPRALRTAQAAACLVGPLLILAALPLLAAVRAQPAPPPPPFAVRCASCHGDEAGGTARGPGLLLNPRVA